MLNKRPFPFPDGCRLCECTDERRPELNVYSFGGSVNANFKPFPSDPCREWDCRGVPDDTTVPCDDGRTAEKIS